MEIKRIRCWFILQGINMSPLTGFVAVNIIEPRVRTLDYKHITPKGVWAGGNTAPKVDTNGY